MPNGDCHFLRIPVVAFVSLFFLVRGLRVLPLGRAWLAGADARGCFPAAGLLALSGSRAARSPGLRLLVRSGRKKRSC